MKREETLVMQEEITRELESSESERQCPYCHKTRALIDFSPPARKNNQQRKICLECQRFKQHERHDRVKTQRETWQAQQQERAKRRQEAWTRSSILRQAYEERQQELENWYLHQPDRYCQMCHCVQAATQFRGKNSTDGCVLHAHCQTCREAIIEQRQLPCCLCQTRTPRRNFIPQFKGYDLCGDGASISLCCKGCEAAFLELSDAQQCQYIRSCCQRTFPAGQVIYAEVDPETHEIRYIGRTGKPKRRHAQHLSDASPKEGQWGAEKRAWYTRRNWMHSLTTKGLAPSMEILQSIENSPFVLEWEQRFIWHGIQRDWKLLNWETMDEELAARIKTSHFNFFEVPFEVLVQHHFFSSHGLVSFLHKSYLAEEKFLCPLLK